MQEPTTEQPASQAAPDPTPAPPTEAGPPLLRRDMSRRMLGGVCAGIARTYDYDVTVVRVVALLLTLPGGVGFVLYAALWALMPADTTTPPAPTPAVPLSNAEELAERVRRAADEFAAATRAAAEAARVAAEQLSEVARAASEAGRQSWESRPSAQAPAPPPAPPAPPAPTAPETPEAPSTPATTPPT